MTPKKEKTSAEIKQELKNLGRDGIKSRYLLPAGDYHPNDKEFMDEVIDILNSRDKNNYFIYYNIIPFFKDKFKCDEDFSYTLYSLVLTNTLRYGYKLNLKQYLADLDKLLSCNDNTDWIAEFCAGDEKHCEQFNELCEFIGCKLIVQSLANRKSNTTHPNANL